MSYHIHSYNVKIFQRDDGPGVYAELDEDIWAAEGPRLRKYLYP